MTWQPVFRGLFKRGDDGRVACDAVERLLDGECALVGGGTGEEVFHDGEGIEWMVHEDVVFFNRLPDVALGGKLCRARGKARIAQAVEAREIGERGEESGAERAFCTVDVHFLQRKLLLEEIEEIGGKVLGDLKAHGCALAPFFERFLDFCQEVFDVVANVEVGVAREAEGRRLHDFPAREEACGEEAQNVLQEEEGRLARQFPQAVEHGRGHGNDGEMLGAFARTAKFHGEIQAAACEEGEGVRGIERHGRHDGIDLALEKLREPQRPLPCQLFGAHEAYALCGEFSGDESEAAIDRAVLAVRLARDGEHLLAGRKPRDVLVRDAARDEMLQAGDADHEEFIEVRAGDGDEAQALQQGILLARRFLEDALVEAQPRTFAVQEIGSFQHVHDDSSSRFAQDWLDAEDFTKERGGACECPANQGDVLFRFEAHAKLLL